MRAAVDVNGVSGQIGPGELVLEEGSIGAKGVPSGERDAVARFPAPDRSEIKGPMNVSVLIDQRCPAAEGREISPGSVGLRCIRWPDQMGFDGGRRRCDLTDRMILEPISLVGGVESDVGRVEDIILHEEAAVLKTGWSQTDGVLKGHPYEAPFPGVISADWVGDKEEFVRALHNVSEDNLA